MFTIFPKTKIKVLEKNKDQYYLYITSRSNALFKAHGHHKIDKIYIENQKIVFEINSTNTNQNLNNFKNHNIALSQIIPLIDRQNTSVAILNKEGILINNIDNNSTVNNIYIINNTLNIIID